jgi:hypothetical protein
MFVIHIGLITLDWWSILAQTSVALSRAADTYDVVFGLNLHFCFFGCIFDSLPCPWYKTVPLSLALSPRIYREVANFKPDIIHASSPGIMVILNPNICKILIVISFSSGCYLFITAAWYEDSRQQLGLFAVMRFALGLAPFPICSIWVGWDFL